MMRQGSTTRKLYTGIDHYNRDELESGDFFVSNAMVRMECPFCEVALDAFDYEFPDRKMLEPGFIQKCSLHSDICPSCGWWHLKRFLESCGNYFTQSREIIRGVDVVHTHAVQAEIDIASNSLPIKTIRQHLLRRWEDRKLISAQSAEDLVASLLKDHHGGEVSRLTANANAPDGGIDLYVSVGSNGAIQRAVQVKRRISIDVESVKDVRNFIGSMVLEGMDHGTFVTTASRFSKPALDVPSKADRSRHRLNLELIDGDRLFEMLRETTSPRDVELPSDVSLDQEWKSPSGLVRLTGDLFLGDFSRARSV